MKEPVYLGLGHPGCYAAGTTLQTRSSHLGQCMAQGAVVAVAVQRVAPVVTAVAVTVEA